MHQLCYLSSARIPSEKANTHQVLLMCKAFADQGVKITLIYPHRDNTPEMREIKNIWAYYGIQQTFSLVELPALDLIRTSDRVLAPFPRLLRATQNRIFPLFTTTYTRSVINFLEKENADIYYTRNPGLSHAILNSRPDLASSLFLEIHAFPRQVSEQRKQANTIELIGGAISITRHLKELYVKAGVHSDRILVAPDGVDLNRYRNKIPSQSEARHSLKLPLDRFIVGYVGRLHTVGLEKGIPQLIQAIANLKRSHPEIKTGFCCVGGPDKMAHQYHSEAIQLGLDPNEAIFISQVPPTEIPHYLSAFDLCAMPFPWTQHYAYYMSPLKLFEYMASHRPILATELPAVQEILTHKQNAYLVPPGDSQALAEGIRWAASHPEDANALAQRAHQDVQQYTWSKRAKRILTFINNRRP